MTAERRKGVHQAKEVSFRRGFIGAFESAGRTLAGVAERTGEMPSTHRRASRRSPSVRQSQDVKKMHSYFEKWDERDEFRLRRAVLGCTRESVGSRAAAWYPLGPNDQMPDNVVGDMESSVLSLSTK